MTTEKTQDPDMSEKALEAASALESLLSTICCCVCTESFTDPRILPCGHTFCLKCLERLERNNALTCPICRKQYPNITQEELAALPRNVTIQEIIDMSKRLNFLETTNTSATSNFSNSMPVNEPRSSASTEEYAEFTVTEINESSKQLHGTKSSCNTFESEQVLDDLQAASMDCMNEDHMAVDEVLKSHDASCEVSTERANSDTLTSVHGPDEIGCSKSELTNMEIQEASVHSQDSELANDMYKKKCLQDKQDTDELKCDNELQSEQKDSEPTGIVVSVDAAREKHVEMKMLRQKVSTRCEVCDEIHNCHTSSEHSSQELLASESAYNLDAATSKIEVPTVISMKAVELICDVCAADDSNKLDSTDLSKACWYCVECSESQCDECNRSHKKQKFSKNHRMIEIDDKMEEDLLQKQKIIRERETKILCDVCCDCDESSEKPEATWYCVECSESQCYECRRSHKKQKFSKNHQVIEIDDKLKENLLQKQKIITESEIKILCDVCCDCDESSEKPLAIWYCVNCSENHCDECSRSHKKQKFSKNHEIITIDDRPKGYLLQKQKIIMEREIKICCDVCKENAEDTDIPIAIWHCVDCNENQCVDCNREHKRQRFSKDHEIVELDNDMKEKLTKMKKSIDICDVCAANNDNGTTDITAATKYCINCQEKQCEQCSQEHRRQKFSKDHNIVKLNDEVKSKYLTKETKIVSSEEQIPATVCDQCEERNGTRTTATMYCTDCEESQCNECSEAHRRQKPCREHKIVPIAERPESIIKSTTDSDPGKSEDSLKRMSEKNSSTELEDQNLSRKIQTRVNQTIYQNLTALLTDTRYSKIQKVIEKSSITEHELEDIWQRVIPYIIQRIKMWNGDVFTSQNLASLIKQTKCERNNSSLSEFGSKHSKSNQNLKDKAQMHPVSRLDCLTYIINAADPIVAQDILRILSKFPAAIPLIVQDINSEDKYIVTIPLIQNVEIKWESTPGQIAENYLFTNPFRMIVAVRIGNNKIGKSTILNQLMRKQFVFSSCCEAGSRYGRPRTLDGCVEMVWLTQETCNDITWKSTMLEHYTGNMDEVAILANLHGEAFQYEDTLKFLLKFCCSFIVFLMPGFDQKKWAQLKKFLSGKISVHVLVDPESNSEDMCLSQIQTALLASDDTQNTMRQLLCESLGMEFNLKPSNAQFESHLTESLKYAKTFKDKNCEKILEMVRNQGCFNTRQLLSRVDVDEPTKWDPKLQNLIKLLMVMVDCPREFVKQSLSCLETQLSQLSGKESLSARSEVREANEKLRRIVKNPMNGNANETKCNQELIIAQEKLQSAMTKAENINIGQEHFFRVMGKLFELSLSNLSLEEQYKTKRLPNYIADLLIEGHAIELLNGDSGEIQMLWMKSICDSVSKKKPNFKVFVISIIGMQSSGKSTLLNALFSCRFAVSVGRCSRGLYMRMIMLDDDLRDNCGCDSIILIDTEGLCSPEKMNDPKASQKDRLMATYAMGVSDLTIVNILGEGMTEMTEILQIAIIAMARLRGGGIKPDILMVQHLQERNVSKIDQAKTQFCEAINKAFELILKKDVEIGSASAECLNELTERIQSGDLFQHFGPFKDGSSVNSPPSEAYHEDVVCLFETLMRRVEASKKKKTFERWSNHFESYWECVKEENFALNFKNVKHITDFLYFEKKIDKAKELLERAILKHREIFATQIREEISHYIGEKTRPQTEMMKRQILDSIEQSISTIPHLCPDDCGLCKEFVSHNETLLQEISGTEWEEDTKRSLGKYKEDLHERSTKFLRQTFDGSAVKQGCFSEFSQVITEELKKALAERPDGVYTHEEQTVTTNKIWELLRGIAISRDSRSDPDARFHQALKNEYANTPYILNNFRNEIFCEALFQMNAVKCVYLDFKIAKVKGWSFGPLDENLKKNLCDTVNSIITDVFKSRGGDEYLKSGLDFEEGMVMQIKSNFLKNIKSVEKRFSIDLKDEFKMNLQVYALQQFNKKRVKLQEIWNKQNRPIEILMKKKKDYLMEIETRLKSGFSCAGEGEIVARQLCKAILKKAIQAAHAENVEMVLSQEWTTNNEKVRLLYLEQLAKEVQSGKKDNALNHFQNPKNAIEEWYKKKVDSFWSHDDLMKAYNSSIKTESSSVRAKIAKSASKEDINRILEHIANVEDQYFSKLNPKDDDFEAFKSSIDSHLNLYLNNKDYVAFPSISDDNAVKRRLGCTQHCYWCGALCWGSRDHQVEKDETSEIECHHSCHQPSGLAAVSYLHSHKLSSISCHNREDTARVFFKHFQEGDGILWSEAKLHHFPDWKFDAHCITKFDELMRWFFQELHQDIARQEGLKPADGKELRENKCVNLKLNEILKVVHSKI